MNCSSYNSNSYARDSCERGWPGVTGRKKRKKASIMNAVQSQIDALSSRVSSNEAGVASIESSIDALSSRVSSNEAGVASIESSILDIQNEINSLNGSFAGLQLALANLLPIGSVLPFSGSVTPEGFLLCDGKSVSRQLYPLLFAAIGVSFGSVDGSTFNLPDMRGRVVAGRDDMGGVPAGRITVASGGIDAGILGSSGGSSKLQSHTHSISYPQNSATFNWYAQSGGPYNIATASTTSATTGSSGEGSSGNIQPTIILNYIIKF